MNCTGHMLVCAKVLVPCEFACHGCHTYINREDVGKHQRTDGEKHAQLLSTALKKFQGEKDWQPVSLVWEVPKVRLQQLEEDNEIYSQAVTVGIYRVQVALYPGKVALYPGNHSQNQNQDCIGIAIIVVSQKHEPKIDQGKLVLKGVLKELSWSLTRMKMLLKKPEDSFCFGTNLIVGGQPLTMALIRDLVGAHDSLEVSLRSRLGQGTESTAVQCVDKSSWFFLE